MEITIEFGFKLEQKLLPLSGKNIQQECLTLDLTMILYLSAIGQDTSYFGGQNVLEKLRKHIVVNYLFTSNISAIKYWTSVNGPFSWCMYIYGISVFMPLKVHPSIWIQYHPRAPQQVSISYNFHEIGMKLFQKIKCEQKSITCIPDKKISAPYNYYIMQD